MKRVFNEWYGPRVSLNSLVADLIVLYNVSAINIQLREGAAYICICKSIDSLESRTHFGDWDYKVEINC